MAPEWLTGGWVLGVPQPSESGTPRSRPRGAGQLSVRSWLVGGGNERSRGQRPPGPPEKFNKITKTMFFQDAQIGSRLDRGLDRRVQTDSHTDDLWGLPGSRAISDFREGGGAALLEYSNT